MLLQTFTDPIALFAKMGFIYDDNGANLIMDTFYPSLDYVLDAHTADYKRCLPETTWCPKKARRTYLIRKKQFISAACLHEDSFGM